MKNILITGGYGFIGSHFIDICIKSNKYRIINIDSLTTGSSLKNLSYSKSDKYIFYKTNICNKKKIRSIISRYKPFAIINFAAETHVDRSILDPIGFLNTNSKGVSVLADEFRLNLMKRNEKKYKFIQISTDEVYGSTLNRPFKEIDKLNPNSPYSSSKAAAELTLRAFEKTYNFKSIILRPSNNFGPRQYKEKLIPLSLNLLNQGKTIPLYGDGKNKREWYYVRDCVKTIYNILNSKIYNGIYNIGGEKVYSNLSLIMMMGKYFQKNFSKDKFYHFVKDRPGHDFMYKLDLSKIKKTGLLENSNFINNLDKTVKYFIKNA